MSPAVDVLTASAGVVLVLAALRDVFHTLFHPGGRGSLSMFWCRASARLTRRAGTGWRLLAGPAAVATTILTWVALLVAGFALVYAVLLPDAASYTSGTRQVGDLRDALYLSMVSLSTLGFGNVVLVDPWWRLLGPLQGLVGFAVLTVAISWIGQLYPALSRRRTLALRVAVAPTDDPGRLDPAVLRDWSAALAAVVVDLHQNAETYWFREGDRSLSLGPLLVTLDEVAAALRDGDADSPAGTLDASLDHVAAVLHRDFGAPSDRSAAFAELA